MKFFHAYQKAARLAREHGAALVVTMDPAPDVTAPNWEAVTVEDFHTPHEPTRPPTYISRGGIFVALKP